MTENERRLRGFAGTNLDDRLADLSRRPGAFEEMQRPVVDRPLYRPDPDDPFYDILYGPPTGVPDTERTPEQREAAAAFVEALAARIAAQEPPPPNRAHPCHPPTQWSSRRCGVCGTRMVIELSMGEYCPKCW